jgi:hypothetical protein
MKISRRLFAKKMAEVRRTALGHGQEQGRIEMMDLVCQKLGHIRQDLSYNVAAHNAALEVQAHLEGQRFLAYFYGETEVEEVIAFSERFYNSRVMDISTTNYLTYPGRNDTQTTINEIVLQGNQI